MKRIASAALGTWRSVLGDPGALLLLFCATALYSFFYPYPYSTEILRKVPVAVVDADHSGLSRKLIQYAQASPSLDVRRVQRDAEGLAEALANGEIEGALVIPEDFSRRIVRGQKAEVLALGDATRLLTAKTLLGGAAQAAGTLSAGIDIVRLSARGLGSNQAVEARAPVVLEILPLFNTSEGYASYVVPMVAPLIVQQALVIGMSLLLGLWAEGGNALPHRLALTHPPLLVFLGLWLAFALIGLANALYFFGLGFLIEDLPHNAALAPQLAFSTLYAVAISGFGLCVASLFDERERGMQVLLFSSIPMLFISGVPWPVESLPQPLVWLRWLLPSTAGINGLVAINQLGASWSEVRTEAFALLLQSLGYGGLAWWRLKRAWFGGERAAGTAPVEQNAT